MAKITGKYEVLYIINPTLGEEGIGSTCGKVQGNGGGGGYSAEHRRVGQASPGLSQSTT